jgi:hypothetical protein
MERLKMERLKIEHRLATVELTPEDCLALAAVLKGEGIDELDGRARLLVGTFAAAFEGIAMAAASESYLGFREIDRFTLAHVRERLTPWRTTLQASPRAAGEGGA